MMDMAGLRGGGPAMSQAAFAGRKGQRPLASPRSARLQPQPITTKRAKRSILQGKQSDWTMRAGAA